MGGGLRCGEAHPLEAATSASAEVRVEWHSLLLFKIDSVELVPAPRKLYPEVEFKTALSWCFLLDLCEGTFEWIRACLRVLVCG
jgi:hypothetical protein